MRDGHWWAKPLSIVLSPTWPTVIGPRLNTQSRSTSENLAAGFCSGVKNKILRGSYFSFVDEGVRSGAVAATLWPLEENPSARKPTRVRAEQSHVPRGLEASSKPLRWATSKAGPTSRYLIRYKPETDYFFGQLQSQKISENLSGVHWCPWNPKYQRLNVLYSNLYIYI